MDFHLSKARAKIARALKARAILRLVETGLNTRMLLHMKHNANHSNQSISFVVHTPDTDVFVLCLGHLNQINGKIFIKTGVKDKTRLINLRKIKDKLELEADEIRFSSDDPGEAFISFHTFTGCDTVSAFSIFNRL